jgi:hypothetical protein
MVFPDVVKGLGHVPDTSAAVVADWDEMAVSTGLPDDPAETPRKQIQWTPKHPAIRDPEPGETTGRQPGVRGATTPPPGPDYVPWDEDPAPTPEAVETPLIDPAYPAAGGPVAAEETERVVDRPGVERIMAAYGDLGYDPADRAQRLALFSAILGFNVTSTNDLERMSAYRLFGDLTKLRDGSLIAIADGHGGFAIHAGTEPEDDET